MAIRPLPHGRGSVQAHSFNTEAIIPADSLAVLGRVSKGGGARLTERHRALECGAVNSLARSIFFVAMTASAATAAPHAGLVGKAWELDFSFYDPQRITVMLPGDVSPTTFWYVLYRVTNRTGQEVQFFPSFRFVTDTLKVVIAGEQISPSVYRRIADRHRRDFPFFAEPSKVVGQLLQGEAHARTSAAVFRTFDPNASRFKLYVSGLSGEIERKNNPVYDPARKASEGNKRFFLFRRTLEVVYDLPGDVRTRLSATPIRRSRGWVMRYTDAPSSE